MKEFYLISSVICLCVWDVEENRHRIYAFLINIMCPNTAFIFVCPQTPSTPSTTPSTSPSTPLPKPTATGWCVPKNGVSDALLQANLDYACSHGIDCGPIQPGGACFDPNTVSSHASYAMNLYYQTMGKNPWNCDFSQTAVLTSTNPSKCSLLPSISFNFLKHKSNGNL